MLKKIGQKYQETALIKLIAVGLVQSGATMVYRETLPQEKRIAKLGASFQKFPQLLAQLRQLGLIQRLHVRRGMDGFQYHDT